MIFHKKIKDIWQDYLYILLLIFFIVMHFSMLSKSLWTDEAFSVHGFAMSGIKGVFLTPYVATNHPFYSLIEAILISIFSYSEILVRMPATIIGAVFLYVLYYYNKKYFGIGVAWGVGLLMMLNDNLVTLMFQARGYTIVFLSTILCLVKGYQWIEENNKKSSWVFCISAVVGIWTFPLFCVLIGFLLVFMLCLIERSRKKEVIAIGGLTVLLSALFYLPMIKSMLIFYSKGMEIFGDKLSWNNFYNYNFNNLLLAIGVDAKNFLIGSLLVVCWLVGMYTLYKKTAISKYLLGAVFGYSTVMMLLQFNTNPRYFTFLESIVIIFIVYGIVYLWTHSKWKLIRVSILIGIFLIIVTMFSAENRRYRKNQILYPIEAYKESVEYISNRLPSYDNAPKIIVCTERRYGFDLYFDINNIENYHIVTGMDNEKVIEELKRLNMNEDIILIDHVLRRDEIIEIKQNREPDFYQIQHKRGYMKVYELEAGEVGDIIDL